jgi:hypothetical protein
MVEQTNQPSKSTPQKQIAKGKENPKEQTNPKWQRTTYNGVAL